jgi:hypothetical protein
MKKLEKKKKIKARQNKKKTFSENKFLKSLIPILLLEGLKNLL